MESSSSPVQWTPVVSMSKEGRLYRIECELSTLQKESGSVFCAKLTRYSKPTGKKSESARDRYRWWNVVTFNADEIKWMDSSLSDDLFPASTTVKSASGEELRNLAVEWSESSWGSRSLVIKGEKKDKKPTKVFVPADAQRTIVSFFEKAVAEILFSE